MLVYIRMVDRLSGSKSFLSIEYNVCGINSNTNDKPVISGNTSSNDIIYILEFILVSHAKKTKQNKPKTFEYWYCINHQRIKQQILTYLQSQCCSVFISRTVLNEISPCFVRSDTFLMATTLPVVKSCAFNTIPWTPSPIFCIYLYLPFALSAILIGRLLHPTTIYMEILKKCIAHLTTALRLFCYCFCFRCLHHVTITTLAYVRSQSFEQIDTRNR